MLALDAALVVRYFRVRLVLPGGEVTEEQVVPMPEQNVPGFKAEVKVWADQEYGGGVTVEAHPA